MADACQLKLPTRSGDWKAFLLRLDHMKCQRIPPERFTNAVVVDIFNRCPSRLVASVLQKLAPTEDYLTELDDKVLYLAALYQANKKKTANRKRKNTDFLKEIFVPARKMEVIPLTPQKVKLQRTIDDQKVELKGVKRKLSQMEKIVVQKEHKALDLEASCEVLQEDLKTQMSDWLSPAVQAEFVDAWRNKEMLYTPSHKDYKNRAKRHVAQQELADMFNSTVDAVLRRMRSLRTQYGRYRQGTPSGSAGKNVTKRQEWILANLGFLSASSWKRQSEESYVLEEDACSSDSMEYNNDTRDNEMEEGDSSQELTAHLTPTSRRAGRTARAARASIDTAEAQNLPPNSARKIPQKRDVKGATVIMDTITTTLASLDNQMDRASVPAPLNAMEIYAQSIVHKMSTLINPANKVTLMNDIDNLIYRAMQHDYHEDRQGK